MKFFNCISASRHATVAGDKPAGKRYAVYEGMIHGFYRTICLDHENNGWFAGWRFGHVVLSNCRDTTWIAMSPSMSHVWHVDRAGSTITVESGAGIHLMFADGLVVDLEHNDLDQIHSWGRKEVYFDSNGFMLHFVWDNPVGQLHVFNINELHLLAAVLARTNQHDYYRHLEPAGAACIMKIA